MIKAMHLSFSLSRGAGGIFEIELAVAQHLRKQEVDSVAFGLRDEHWLADKDRWSPVRASVYDVKGPSSFCYSPDLLRSVLNEQADCGHLHSMWAYTSVVMRKWAESKRKPFLVTPNGMLEPWALRNAAWKKRLAGFLYEKRMLKQAACLQANTSKELNDIRNYGCRNPIAVIPNGVELPVLDTLQDSGSKTDHRDVLFLGRLHPKKGLPNAIRAWRAMLTEAKGCAWRFLIAGWDQMGHQKLLMDLCDELNVPYREVSASEFLADGENASPPEGSVVFLGPAFGNAKNSLFKHSKAFILPSFSEGLPMSVLEAWSYAKPVLMTDHCNLPEGFSSESAFRIGTEVDSICEGLLRLSCTDEESLKEMGKRGRALVERRYTWDHVTLQLTQVYEWMIGGGDSPDFVRRP